MAAGDGTRMKSGLPKVLHRAAGKPLVGHVVDAARGVGAAAIALVVPVEHTTLRETLGEDFVYAVQDPPRGTGDAAACGLRALGDKAGELVLVVNGDGPCIRASTLQNMLDARGEADAVFLTVNREDPTGYGRIVRGADGALQRIVEESDCSEEQRKISEVNAGVYLFEAGMMAKALDALTPDNAQGELYLTDALEVVNGLGGR
ncbi:MAG: NTP transferase domain-containing protein, partial [Gammaproteobacteria bacterium]|nr:NTP transferase domain-containing protein [Gemmatimonadota bacterium]NIV50746.1 NTP transferase domain-containing protein [Gammaproteobacteria bacterium]NIY34422.1 NTP transferase domain-containing protein [Gemmatimonadota bacterium]